ncbi:hypothetical protein [Vibrio sp. NTOU-M3]|uniref:hypothetical protein n=1 Tax=unclassified Vibrio TaxID=2614977 RepID=UPI00349F4C43
MKYFLLVFFVLLSSYAYAFRIDYMLITADDNGNGVFTVGNNMDYRQFISTSVAELYVKDGNIYEKPYTKKNIKEWEVTLTNPKFILNRDEMKQVGVLSLCNDRCNETEDKVYKITFSPEPYGEEKVVNVNFGYAPLFIMPAKQANISYKVKNTGETLIFENTGNTYLRFMVDGCEDADSQNNCRLVKTSLAGRYREYDLPDVVKNKDIEVLIINHDESYKKRVLVRREL